MHSTHIPINCVPVNFGKMMNTKKIVLKGKRGGQESRCRLRALHLCVLIIGMFPQPTPLLMPRSVGTDHNRQYYGEKGKEDTGGRIYQYL